MQLKVIKRDRSVEEYFHTKVIGTFNHALSMSGQADLFMAEQFAEAVTFYLHRKGEAVVITSDDIYLLVRSVLNTTGYEMAALAMDEWRMVRKLKRKRIEVITSESDYAQRWDKSQIVADLIEHEGLDRSVARAIAASVEERVFNIGITHVTKTLIKQLVLADMSAMMLAESQLAVG